MPAKAGRKTESEVELLGYMRKDTICLGKESESEKSGSMEVQVENTVGVLYGGGVD